MIKNLPFGALRVFESAARHLSFKKAAEELYITPAAVSQQIKTLEAQLDIKLFRRYSRGLSLTAEAERGLETLSAGFDQISQAYELMQSADLPPRLTIWMAPSFASKWFMPRLNRFSEKFPGIDLEISASPGLVDTSVPGNPIPAENFQRDKVDIAIRFGKGNYPGCRVDKLFAVYAIPLCSPDLMTSNHPLKTPDDLRFHTLIHDNTRYEGRPDWKTWLSAAGVSGLDGKRGMHFNHGNLAINAAVEGQGIVLSMKALASDDIAAGRLIIPFNLELPLINAYYMISHEDADNHPHAALFREWLLEEAVKEED